MSQAGRLFDGTILPDIETLTGNSGGAVGPTGGNINVVGDGTTIDITGNPGTSTLTASFIGTTDITITGDTGGAQTGNSFTFNGGTTGLSFGGAADVFTTTFAGITANGGTVSLATDATNSTVNVGTGAGIKTTTLGSTNTTSSTEIRSGTGNIAMNSGLTVDSSGRWTSSVQPMFLVGENASPTNVTGDLTVYQVPFDTEVYDIGGNFAANQFTAPKTGKYLLTANISFISSDTYLLGSMGIQTTSAFYIAYNGQFVSTAYSQRIFTIASMTAGDTAKVFLQIGNAAKTIQIQGNTGAGAYATYFSGMLIS